MNKVIITCAITGSIHTPSMSDYLPVTPDEIVSDAIAASEAGAAMIHLHARDPRNGKPSADPEIFAQFLPRIKQQTNAILNITTGGGPGMSMDERLSAALWAKPEVASMNMGSVNFNISPLAERIKNFKYEWEKPALEATKDMVLSNTFTQIERGLRELGDHGTRFEFECYEIGHLHNLAWFADKGIAKPPFFVQGVFGVLGALMPVPEHLMHMKHTADKLFGRDYNFSALAAGRHQLPMITLSAILGGNVRVGLEDSLYIGPGRLAKTSAEQVGAIRTILETLGMQIATPDEARAILQTKGADKVNF